MNVIIASIIVPAFNRLAPLRHTLESARAACMRLGRQAEIILVDDGSTPPLAEAAPELTADSLVKIIRQPNQGSIIARQTGLAAARGEFILFLDSDDLISVDKLHRHCGVLSSAPDLAVTYDDLGQPEDPANPDSPVRLLATCGRATDLADLLLRVQPAPHGCVYRRTYLIQALASPVVAPERSLDPSGDVWLYYNLSIHPASFAKIDAPLTFPGIHDEARYSQCWERLGIASLRLAERFMAATATSSASTVLRARELAGECAFNSWRRLPRDFSPAFTRRQLALWHQAPHGPHERLGGPLFRTLAALLGPIVAGRILRLRNAPYARSRTIGDDALERLLAA